MCACTCVAAGACAGALRALPLSDPLSVATHAVLPLQRLLLLLLLLVFVVVVVVVVLVAPPSCTQWVESQFDSTYDHFFPFVVLRVWYIRGT